MQIRLTNNTDSSRLAAYYLRNKSHFKQWATLRDADYYSVDACDKRVREFVEAQESGHAVYFVAVDSDEIIAHCTLSNIVRGVFQACYMGFAVSHTHQGQGVMRLTCSAAIDYAFGPLKLHRIMANYMPHNNRSAALLKRLGFVKEGLAKDYLKINGKWENHVLTSLTNPRMM